MITKHNGNLEGKAPDVPEAIGNTSQKSHTSRMEEEKFARRTRSWNDHLPVVGSRCKDPEAKEYMASLLL